jgi:hypothetical protein
MEWIVATARAIVNARGNKRGRSNLIMLSFIRSKQVFRPAACFQFG